MSTYFFTCHWRLALLRIAAPAAAAAFAPILNFAVLIRVLEVAGFELRAVGCQKLCVGESRKFRLRKIRSLFACF